ncbi:hypothetical protein [Xylanibacter muris]|uniref:Uncharacterized protein n=1 Tax=Xylanibacter muris TaxID=2736290 RepID=A0ABX2AKH2_9BACT|nr:hypothetical protein [Xylanibacter muris]NPD91539.1 hypothetical protein [Xylanibacter muris]
MEENKPTHWDMINQTSSDKNLMFVFLIVPVPIIYLFLTGRFPIIVAGLITAVICMTYIFVFLFFYTKKNGVGLYAKADVNVDDGKIEFVYSLLFGLKKLSYEYNIDELEGYYIAHDTVVPDDSSDEFVYADVAWLVKDKCLVHEIVDRYEDFDSFLSVLNLKCLGELEPKSISERGELIIDYD